MKVFISYAREDKQQVMELVSALSSFYDVWIDWEDIRAGSNWKQGIEEGIRCCDVFLFVVSVDSCSSQHCAWECQLALDRRKRIIPLILDDSGYLRPEIAQLQWIFLTDFEKGVRQLLQALQPDPPYLWMLAVIVEAAIIGILLLHL